MSKQPQGCVDTPGPAPWDGLTDEELGQLPEHQQRQARLERKKAEDKRKQEGRKAWAATQGYALVQLSPRKYMVVKIDNNGGFQAAAPFKHQGKYLSLLTAENLFQGSYQDCRDYVEERYEPLPKELAP